MRISAIRSTFSRRRVVVRRAGACGALRQPGSPCLEGRKSHDGSGRAGRPVLASGRAAGRGGNPYRTLPAFCRVAATLTPTSDSDIKVEVWLPASGWNGKFQAVGNGGWAGVDQLFRHGRRGSRRVCERVHRHRTRGRPRHLCARSSRKADRLRLALRTRNDGEGEGDHPGVLRQRAETTPTGTAARPAEDRASRKRRCFPRTTTASSPARRPTARQFPCGLRTRVLKDPASYIPPAKYPIIHQAAARRLRRARRPEGRPHRRSRRNARSIRRSCSARARTVARA